MKHASLSALLLVLGAAAAVAQEQEPAPEPLAGGKSWVDVVQGGPGPREPDQFHPERDRLPEPRKGGRVLVHLSTLPKHVNYMTENSAVTRRMLYEIHEFLVQRNWETWEHEPVLAKEWIVEDTVRLKDGGRVFGEVREEGAEDGESVYVVRPLSKENPLEAETRIPASEVEKVDRETVFTFYLRDDAKWQDGHPFDAHDVLFSYRCYRNPSVDCDTVRFQFEKFEDAEVLGPHTIRFFYGDQYFLAKDAFTSLMILPAHLYDLSDPDNPDHDPEKEVGQQEQGRYVNENPHNTSFVGLGPYRMTAFGQQYVEAKRWDDYFDPSNGGYVDTIRWAHIHDDDAAKQALINGELDYWERMKSEEYFEGFTQHRLFREHFYKALASQPYMGYVTWNMRKFKFADPQVRRALNMAFDWEEYIESIAYDLATRITGSQYYFAPHYDHSIEPVPFDLAGAEDLLAEAGWYDRDGSGVVDKDGVELVVEFMMPTGNKVSELIAQKWQEQLAKIGVKMNIVTREWATFLERLYDRDYDCANLAWIQEVESDPEQLWHSKWAEGRSSNHCGLADAEVDRLIEEIQVELDREKRKQLFFDLQARIYELQPYMFGLAQPKKIAVSQKIRNLKFYALDPGYRIREWFLVEPGSVGRVGPEDG